MPGAEEAARTLLAPEPVTRIVTVTVPPVAVRFGGETVAEPIEGAGASIVSPTQLTYRDIDGDNVTVTFSKPILTSDGLANSFFGFSTGNVNGSNATPPRHAARESVQSAAGSID